jgi:hypothetical protein
MRRFKTGMLVRVRDTALTKGIHAETNSAYVANHGYLWIVISMVGTDGGYIDELKSVATGEVSTFFIDSEVEAAEPDDA